MALITVGFNHKNTPSEVLGKTIIPAHRINAALKELTCLPSINAAVILTTCNRCEIYADIHQEERADVLQKWFIGFTRIPATILQEYVLTLSGRDTVQHLMRVAASLESMLPGETQILGQVKSAYQTAQAAGTLNKHLARLFENALSAAKEVRNTTEIAKHAVSFPSLAVKISQRIFEDLEKKHALLIGSGEMLQLTAQNFRDNGLKRATVSNRSPERMRKVATWFQGEIVPLEQVNGCLDRFDIIISATASEAPIINKAAVAKALGKRKHKPMYLVDLALPHDIESDVGDLEDAYLYTLEKLAKAARHNRNRRMGAMAQAEAIIQLKVGEYCKWVYSNRAVGIITHIRDAADLVKRDSLEKALKQLRNGRNAEEVLNLFATTLTNRLTHQPTQLLKDAAAEEEYSILQAIERLLER